MEGAGPLRKGGGQPSRLKRQLGSPCAASGELASASAAVSATSAANCMRGMPSDRAEAAVERSRNLRRPSKGKCGGPERQAVFGQAGVATVSSQSIAEIAASGERR